ncbi:MAG: NAD+ synthase [bacterium]
MGLVVQISNWINSQVKKANAEGIVVGLSGGIDSSVVAALSKKAVGDKLLGLIMPCQSESIDEKYALLVASCLKIKTERIALDTAYEKLLEAFPSGNKLAVANIKPRLRMLTLYYFANNLNYLVAGTGNKSEIMVGYFTKYGDGGVDILPLGGLLKTQVRQLARELDIPKEILSRVPTAGLWHNQTDEWELGITYEDLDKVLKVVLESKKTTNLPHDLIAKVKGLIKTSEHKRALPAIFGGV